MNPEPTDFNLDVANYLKNQDSSQNHPWKKGATLIIGDLILSGLREFQMSKRKTIKLRTFPGATIGDIKFFVIPHSRKKPDKIVLPVGTSDASHATPKEMFNDIKNLKSFRKKYAPESKIIISMPVLRADKTNRNGINERYIKLLKEAKLYCIFNDNICDSRKESDFRYTEFLKKRDSQKRILVYNLNDRDTSINSSKHGCSSKYLKSDSNITAVFTHVEHHRDTIIDLRTAR